MMLWPCRASSARRRNTRSNKPVSTRRGKLALRGCEGLEARLLLTADLSITKSQIAPLSAGVPSAVSQGEMISYQITVANTGATGASNTMLSDSLPAGETLISASSNTGVPLSLNGGTVSGNLGTINAGGSVTVTVDALVNGTVAGTLTNTASVSSPDASSGVPIVSAPVATTVNALPAAAASLSITKTAANNDAAVSVGASETYTLTVTNHGTNPAQNVSVSDVLPVGATFQSGTVSGGTGQTVLPAPTNGLENINLGTLAANGGSATITMTVTAPNLTGLMVNTATVASTSGNATVGNATASVATAVQGTTSPTTGSVDLSIAKNLPATGSVGASQTETITVTNQGTAPATGVVVSDRLPTGAQFISGSTSVAGVNVAATGGIVAATLPSLSAGQSATVTLTVNPTTVGALTDTAYAESDQPDANQTNNVATATTLIAGLTTPAVDLSVTKTASSTTGQIGSNEIYTITVTNNSANVATGVVLSDLLPANANFVSATAGTTSLLPVGNIVTDRIGTLAGGATQTFTVTLAPTAVGAITDAAYVTGDQVDPNVANNIATLTTPVQGTATPNVDLSITKTAANNSANVALGNNETYILTVTNNGTSPATGVVVSDVLPAAATFVGGGTSVSGVNVANVNGAATADLGTLNAGQSATLTVTLTPTAVGSLTNTAYVEANETDANQANNLATVTTQVVSPSTQANLSIAKLAAPSPGTVGQDLFYTLVVTNTGAIAADNVSVSDTLPAGVTFVADNSNVSGATLSNNNGTITASLGSVAPGSVDVVTIVVLPSQAGTLNNTATVTTTSPNASGNTSSTIQTPINPLNGNEANLSITKTASPNPDTVGQNLTYTLTVTNAAGAAAADNVVVTDTLPSSGITFVSGSTDVNGVSVTNNNGTVSANLGTVAAGATDTITIVVTPTQAGTLTNTATIATTTQNASANTSSTVQTTVNPTNSNQANLSITKTASPSPDPVGQNLTYTITVTNAAGAAAADNVVVTDTLPSSGIVFVSGTTSVSGVTATNNNGTVTANLGTVAPGATDTITIVVTPTQAGTLTNTASVTTTTQNASSNTSATINTAISTAAPPGHSCYLNGQPGDNSDQTFLTNLYRELLNRNPDATGFQHWLNFLATNGGTTASGQSNASTRQFVVQAFLHSQEYEANFVDCVFDEFLGRRADEGGQKFFVNQLSNGLPEQNVIVDILSSPEYFRRPNHGEGNQGNHGNQGNQGNQDQASSGQNGGNSNQAFVDNLYVDLLGRPADPTSEQTWVTALNNGQVTRQQVVQDFLQSPEAAKDILDAVGATAGAPGTPATGSYPLAVITGGGWDNLYFQGRLASLNGSAVDQFMSELENATPWQTVQQQMLTLPQYYNAI